MKKQPDPTNATNPVQRERTPVRSVRTPVANRNAEKPAAPTRNGPAVLVETALLTKGSALAPGALAFAIETNAIVTPTMPVSAPPERERELRTHDGYEWLYVLSGKMRLILGEHDITMGPGEVAEFDTRLPHWFGPAGDQPVEILSVHGSHGQRMHVRAAPRSNAGDAANKH